MRIVNVFVLVLLCCSAALSQITVTSSDAQSLYAPGKSWRNLSVSSLNLTMNLGTAGSSAQTWQMPTVVYTDTIRTDNMLPSATPYASRFPRATHVQRATLQKGDTTTTGYSYFRITTDSLVSLGYALRTQSPRGDTAIFAPQSMIQILFPVQLGRTFTRQDSIPIIAGSYVIDRTVSTYDGFGSLVTSAGTFQTIRAKQVTYSETWFGGALYSKDSSTSINWFTKEGYLISVNPKDKHQSAGNQIITSASYTIPLGATGVSDQQSAVPAEYVLQQNYPNPFNPSTTIRFSLADAGHVTLKVYNILGVEVAAIVNDRKEAGTFSVRWNAAGLPSGIYLYRLSATSDKGQVFEQSKKLTLIK